MHDTYDCITCKCLIAVIMYSQKLNKTRKNYVRDTSTRFVQYIYRKHCLVYFDFAVNAASEKKAT